MTVSEGKYPLIKPFMPIFVICDGISPDRCGKYGWDCGGKFCKILALKLGQGRDLGVYPGDFFLDTFFVRWFLHVSCGNELPLKKFASPQTLHKAFPWRDFYAVGKRARLIFKTHND